MKQKFEDVINRENLQAQLRHELMAKVQEIAKLNEGGFKFRNVGMQFFWMTMTDTLLILLANSMAHQALFMEWPIEDFFPKMGEDLVFSSQRAHTIIYNDHLTGKRTNPVVIL